MVVLAPPPVLPPPTREEPADLAAGADHRHGRDKETTMNPPRCPRAATTGTATTTTAANEEEKKKDPRRRRPPPSRAPLFWALLSHGLFFVASVLYVALAANQWRYEREVRDYPASVLDADDEDPVWDQYGYEDDYVIFTPYTKRWISEYAVLYFSASLGFVLAGLVDLYRWRCDALSLVMIMAATMGLAAASVAEDDETLSNRLSFCSVHLWLLDAVALVMAQHRRHGLGQGDPQERFFLGGAGNGVNTTGGGDGRTTNRPIQQRQQVRLETCLASASFVVGTLMDVIISWFYVIRDVRGRVGLPLAAAEIVAAVFWTIAATIFLVIVIPRGTTTAAGGEHKPEEETEREPSSMGGSVGTTTAREKGYVEFFA
jgi:hypothetical protein